MKTPEQRRRNRNTALAILVFVAAVFAWVIVKQYIAVH
ncbi:cytochrome oxidase small assembly protein [Orrella sp. JC864]